MEIKRLEDFIKYIPETVTGTVSKARHLYLELGKRSFYDPEYKYSMFGEAEDDIRYISKQYSNPNIVICTTLAEQYCTLLDMAKIPNTIEYESGLHCFNIFQDENGTEHEADLTQDLKNIQFGCRTSYFGLGTIEPEELRKIDISLGYISEERGYSDEYWHIIKDSIQDERLSQKQRLELIFANLHRIGDPQRPGITELFSMYQKFIQYAMPDTDDLSIYSMKTNRYEQEKYIVELLQNGRTIKYVLNSKTRIFEEMKERNSNNLQRKAKKFPTGPKEDGR